MIIIFMKGFIKWLCSIIELTTNGYQQAMKPAMPCRKQPPNKALKPCLRWLLGTPWPVINRGVNEGSTQSTDLGAIVGLEAPKINKRIVNEATLSNGAIMVYRCGLVRGLIISARGG